MNELIDRLIDLAFAEDIGDGDHTTLSCIPATAMGKSKLLIKEAGVLAGIEIAKEIFHRFDPTMKVEVFINDGAEVKPGDVAMVVEGKIQSLLQTERLMLNVMQRMSGIATMTRKYVKQLEGTKTRVLDTRKTTPGLRMLEKAAVKIGGGVNHRIGLFDMILLKDNHVDFAGGIDKAINRAKEYCKEKGKDLKIEIEVRNFRPGFSFDILGAPGKLLKSICFTASIFSLISSWPFRMRCRFNESFAVHWARAIRTIGHNHINNIKRFILLHLFNKMKVPASHVPVFEFLYVAVHRA